MRIIKDLKRRALDYPYFRRIYVKRKGSMNELLSGTDPLLLDQKDPVLMKDPPDLKVGLVKDHHALKKVPFSAYWPKYERFLRNNGIHHRFYDVHRSDWIESAKEFDLIVWRVNSDPISLEEAREKIYFLENFLGKRCFPTSQELWSNEDKLRESYLLKRNSIPTPDTFITYSEDEALSFVEDSDYPLISKIRTGASSRGVTMLGSRREARDFVKKVFSGGKQTYWPYLDQAGYVYLQEYLRDAKYDLRVIVLGDMLSGYKRYPAKGDFRASGAGNVVRGPIPKEALDLAWRTNEALKKTILAVDMLHDGRRGFLVTEVSSFFRVDDGIELEVGGVQGFYRKLDNAYKFTEGTYWIQELTLREVLAGF